MLSPNAIDDLARSGLAQGDVKARPITQAEMSAVGMIGGENVDGYLLPYFDLKGDPVPYYRIRFLGTHAGKQKYRGPKDAGNHIYFPPGFANLIFARDTTYVLITEGEKKAASAVANGVPCIGLGGVDNWRNRQLLFPEGCKMKPLPGRNMIQAKLPSGDSNDLVFCETGTMAEGMAGFIDICVQRRLTVIIAFDTDEKGVKMEVQRAATQLAYELRFRGIPIPKIRQMVLVPNKRGVKIGLDDFLVIKGVKALNSAIRSCMAKRSAFPRHPNPIGYVSSKLQTRNMSRKQAQEIALTILMELEAGGKRLRNKDSGVVYYFDATTTTLMEAILGNSKVMLHDTELGAYLYRQYNIGAADLKVMQWLATQFNGEEGIEDTVTNKVIAVQGDNIAIQISDSHYVMITPDPSNAYEVCENGSNGLLFEQGQVDPIGRNRMVSALAEVEDDPKENMLWMKVLGNFNFMMPEQGDDSVTLLHVQQLAALLYYLSPWLLRWRGMQLPVELTIGQPGSGKSSLYELRQTIITGQPRLSNMTNDIKDWYAGITSRGGLYVMDNIHFTGSGKDYRQRLSDEICRLVTEPRPHVELRKLYTTSDVVSMPVSATFAFTALEQPFPNADLIQRAAIFELQPITSDHNADWARDQLAIGGDRVGWLAHQMVTIHRFLKLAVYDGRWDTKYRANHRLAHYEQGLMLMAEVFGLESDWIGTALQYRTGVSQDDADMTFNGLDAFVEYMEEKYPVDLAAQKFGVSEISTWASTHDIFKKVGQLNNPNRLSKYIQQHSQELEKGVGIYPNGKHNNRKVFSISLAKEK